MTNNLKMFRAKYGLTQEDVANELDISTLAYRQKEGCKRPFTLDEAKKLSTLFNESIETIFFGHDVHNQGTDADETSA